MQFASVWNEDAGQSWAAPLMLESGSKMKRRLVNFEVLVVSIFVFGFSICDGGTHQAQVASADAQGLNAGPSVAPTPGQARPVGPAGGAPKNAAGITPINPGGPIPIRPRGVTLPNAGGRAPVNPVGAAPVRPGGATPVNPVGPTPVNPGGTMRGSPGAVIPRNSGAVPVLVIPRQTTMMHPANPVFVSPKPMPTMPGAVVPQTPVPGSGAAPLPTPKVPPGPNPAPAPLKK